MKFYHAIVVECNLDPCVIDLGIFRTKKLALSAIRLSMDDHMHEFPNDHPNYTNLVITDPCNDYYHWKGHLIVLNIDMTASIGD